MQPRRSLNAMSQRHAPPVEMRFLDLFIATVGVLAFLAMLFAWLLANMSDKGIRQSHADNASPPEALRLLTRQLPAARVAEDYQLVFAYRGGSGRISWRLAAGEQDIPEGITFNAKLGALSGVPKTAERVRFVLQVRDETGNTDTHAYELTIDPPTRVGSRAVFFIAIVLLLLTTPLWLMALVGLRISRQALNELQDARDKGYAKFKRQGGEGVTELIDINHGGIKTKENDIRVLRGISIALGLIVFMLSTYVLLSAVSSGLNFP